MGERQRKWQALIYSKSGLARTRADGWKMKVKVKYVVEMMSLECPVALFAFITVSGEFISNFFIKKLVLPH